MKKIIIKLKDEDVELCEKEFNIDLEKLLKNFANAAVDGLKQIALAHKTNISLDTNKLSDFANLLGTEIFKNSKVKEN